MLKVGSGGLEVSILQYVDDTLFVGEACWDNLWVMKTVLRCFELVSGLKVYFKKSSLVSLNVEESFVSAASMFLNCKRGRIPFKYLGLPVGANSRNSSTWQPVIDTMERMLASWKGKHMSLGGRITLINSVLNSLPIYYLSFLRMPRKVLKILVRLQRDFLWGGSVEKRKISWVRWERFVSLKRKEG